MRGYKWFRLRNGMTQADVADALGVTQGAVSQWESGLCDPCMSKLKRLTELFHCSIDDLVGVFE